MLLIVIFKKIEKIYFNSSKDIIFVINMIYNKIINYEKENNEYNLIKKYSKIFPPLDDNYSLYIISLNKPNKPKHFYKLYQNAFIIFGKYYKYNFNINNFLSPGFIDLQIISRINYNKYFFSINNVIINQKNFSIKLENNFSNYEYIIDDLYNKNINEIINNLTKFLYFFKININYL